MIDFSSNLKWKLRWALARYAGLRIPSESNRLTPADVDWERGRLTVRSPKTEHHEGHESRTVPIEPKLMELLIARYNEMEEGETYLTDISGQGNMTRWVEKITAAAGVELWPRLWQTLRSSREKHWAMTYPQYVVSYWMGHSIEMSGKHYANAVPDEIYERVSGAAQNPAQQPALDAANDRTAQGATPRETQEIAHSGKGVARGYWRRRESNRRATLQPV